MSEELEDLDYFWDYNGADRKYQTEEQRIWLDGDGNMDVVHPVLGDITTAPQSFLLTTLSAATLGSWQRRVSILMTAVEKASERGYEIGQKHLGQMSQQDVIDSDSITMVSPESFVWTATAETLSLVLHALVRDVANNAFEVDVTKTVAAAGRLLRRHDERGERTMDEAQCRFMVASSLAHMRSHHGGIEPENAEAVLQMPQGFEVKLMMLHNASDAQIVLASKKFPQDIRPRVLEALRLVARILNGYLSAS